LLEKYSCKSESCATGSRPTANNALETIAVVSFGLITWSVRFACMKIRIIFAYKKHP
jgi:hypothetical protein